jgi:hypothetical protein
MNVRSFRPAYFFKRLDQMWFAKAHPDAPWLAKSAILLLDSYLKPGDIGFEWGSGRSTLWFAQRVAHLYSVEDNRDWYGGVTKTLEAAKLMRKVTYHFIPCDCTDVDEPANHAYANVAKTIQDNSLDFALVDGNIRAPCMQIIIAKIKTGGLLILDNANRFIPNRHLDENTTVHEPRFEPRTVAWRGIIDQLETWRWINTTNGIWDTRFWIKAPPPPNDRCKRANHDTLLNGERKFHDQDRPLS